jgi:alkanesulfonate monooxygenase SsuD/methylene tetrahydromethanopterin reductase-like flavin-dependent oxidoreductase (luciferase family)
VTAPFADGSVSMRLYPHELAPGEVVEELRWQAELAVRSGFDGVMVSEHHGGFAGYLPNPLQVAGWLLEAMPTGWAAPCPLLITLRPPALVAEEVAWLAARFPGRVGVGAAAGALQADFEIAGASRHDLAGRFRSALETLAGVLQGTAPGPLAGDPAVARCRVHPVPVVSAAMSSTAVRRAADLGVGLVMDSLTASGRCRQLVQEYRAAGGSGPCILIRRAWLGPAPTEQSRRQVDIYRSYSSPRAQQHWGGDELIQAGDPAEVAERLASVMEECGAGSLNVRVHSVGLGPEIVREQIAVFGAEVLPRLARVGRHL